MKNIFEFLSTKTKMDPRDAEDDAKNMFNDAPLTSLKAHMIANVKGSDLNKKMAQMLSYSRNFIFTKLNKHKENCNKSKTHKYAFTIFLETIGYFLKLLLQRALSF